MMLDGQLQNLVALGLSLLDDGGLAAHGVGQVGEEGEVIAENLGAEDTASRDEMVPVGPDLERQLVEVVMLPTRVFSTV